MFFEKISSCINFLFGTSFYQSIQGIQIHILPHKKSEILEKKIHLFYENSKFQLVRGRPKSQWIRFKFQDMQSV